MSDPKIADKQPAVLELEAGTYYWCACGESAGQPFCDGAHKTTEFRPQPIQLEEQRKVALCNCKRTSNPPYCDGTHSKL